MTNQSTATTAKIAPIFFFILVVIGGIWLTSEASAIIAKAPRDGSPLNSSAITLWSSNRGTDPVSNSNAGIIVRSNNYPLQTSLGNAKPRADLKVIVLEENKEKKMSVSFAVQNVGDLPARDWNVTAQYGDDEIFYISEKQSELAPGKQRTFSLSFTGENINTFIITVDPQNDIAEINEDNNNVSVSP